MSRALVLGVLSVFLVSMFPVQAQDAPEPAKPLYVIQPGDALEIFVWKEPELSREVLVRPDGRISFPLIQDMDASGMTPEELRSRVEELLSQYLSAPNVTVIVTQINHYKIYVTGKVQNPQSFTLPEPVNVLQALSIAGGFAEYADESDIKIVRNYGDRYVYLDFNYKDVIKGKNLNQNIILRTGDVIVVP